jgi:hypothetical protein
MLIKKNLSLKTQNKNLKNGSQPRKQDIFAREKGYFLANKTIFTQIDDEIYKSNEDDLKPMSFPFFNYLSDAINQNTDTLSTFSVYKF